MGEAAEEMAKGKEEVKAKGKTAAKASSTRVKVVASVVVAMVEKATMAEKTTMVVVAALVVVGEYELLVPKDVDVLKRKLGKESPRDAASMASLASQKLYMIFVVCRLLGHRSSCTK